MAQSLDLVSIRQSLLEKEALILQRLQPISQEITNSSRENEKSDPGRLYERWERNQIVYRRESLRLERIQGALRRIEDGTYGICTHCGRPITPDRLYALPYAELCIRCQRMKE